MLTNAFGTCEQRATLFSLATLSHRTDESIGSLIEQIHPQMRKKRLNADPGEFGLMRSRDMHHTHRVTQSESVMLSVVRLSDALKNRYTVS